MSSLCITYVVCGFLVHFFFLLFYFLCSYFICLDESFWTWEYFSIVLRLCFLWICLLFLGGWRSIVKSKFGEQFVKGVVTAWCLSILDKILIFFCIGLEFHQERFAFGCLLVWFWILRAVVQRINGDLFFCYSTCFSIKKLLNIKFLLLFSPFPSFSNYVCHKITSY